MSKKISFKGKLNIGTQDRLKLSTIKGKIGYKINKLQIISTTPGTVSEEIIVKIYKSDQGTSISPTVDLSDSDILAAVYYTNRTDTLLTGENAIIMDNEVFNQDIYVTADSANSSTVPTSYYIELESMSLSDIESTQLTLKNLRTIASQ
jgi:hypothetical protein